MSGQLLLTAPEWPLARHTHAVLGLSDGRRAALRRPPDLRGAVRGPEPGGGPGPSRTRPAVGRVVGGRPGPGTGRPDGPAQAPAHGPAVRGRDRQHLLRRGAVRGPAPLRPARPGRCRATRSPGCTGPCGRRCGTPSATGARRSATPSTSTCSARPATTRTATVSTAGKGSPASAAAGPSGGSPSAAVRPSSARRASRDHRASRSAGGSSSRAGCRASGSGGRAGGWPSRRGWRGGAGTCPTGGWRPASRATRRPSSGRCGVVPGRAAVGPRDLGRRHPRDASRESADSVSDRFLGIRGPGPRPASPTVRLDRRCSSNGSP